VVIPIYNAEKTIGKLVDELIAGLSDKYNLEIVLVNDNSQDNSEEVCISLHKKYNDLVSFYSLSRNVGEHNAVMAGLNNVSGEFVVIMDDDFQNPISEVIKLISFATKNDYDVVYTYYEKKKHSFLRNLGSWFNDKVANLMLKKPKDLYLSSFKIINKFIVHEIIKYDLPFSYIDGLILRTTDSIGKIRVKHDERKSGKSGYTVKKLVSLWLNMFTNFSILPLRVSVVLGFVFSSFGLLLGVATIIEKIMNPEIPQGIASLIVIISIFSGVQLIAIGMVGEYLGRVFLSQNKAPQYSVKSKFIANVTDS